MLFRIKQKTLLLDLYEGCFHGCQKCLNKPNTLPTEQWVTAKPIQPTETLLQNLKTELAEYTTKNKIVLGNNSDPYQPIERYYQITKKIIQHILDNGYYLTIQTKSSDILRDIELFERFKNKSHIVLKIPSLDTKKTTELEPQASTIHERLFALKTIHYLEIPHSIKITPILPETNIIGIIKKLKTLNQKFIIDKPIGIEPKNWKKTKNKIKKITEITKVFE